ncbi:MAG TPA: ATP-binding protein [Candidatus Saccharimonadales bacterium]|nr:ATP-binding protein [Candidatus Saccharimonadales bacterium]
MKIFLGGINGVGKTTVLRQLGLRLPHIKIILGSKSYMHFLGLVPNDYEGLRSLPEKEHQVKLRKFIKKHIRGASKQQTFIFDGHFVVFDQGSAPITKVADWIKDFDLMILLEASPSDIYNRVFYDQKNNIRQRSYMIDDKELAIDVIQKRLNYTRNVANRSSEWFNVPLLVVSNDEIDLTVQTIIDYIGDENATNI